jgi:alkylhydroperoxidase family enzyme
VALVPSLNAEQIPEEYRYLLKRPINLFRALANTPEGFKHFHKFSAEWMRFDTSLDARIRELLILQVGYLTRSPYEWSHHIVLARQFGVTDEDIQGIIDYTDGKLTSLPDNEVAVLRAVTELTENRYISDDAWNDIKSLFVDQDLTEIVLIGATYSAVVRILGGLRIEVEPGEFADALAQFPLPD